MKLAKKLEAGARFECKACGYCCSSKDGNIYVFPPEIPPIIKYLELKPRDFFRKYIHVVEEEFFLVRVPTLVFNQRENGECIFLDEKLRCKIYPVRPFQCVGFPFWRMNVKSNKSWDKLKKFCQGIDEGPLFSKRKIIRLVKKEIALEEDYIKKMGKVQFDIRKIYPELP